MRIFLTGATGFIGSAIVPELIAAGHSVLGLTRSNAGAAALAAAGADAHRGDLDDLDTLARGAAAADGVIHCAFDHDFAHFVENCDKDRRVIEALAGALAGSNRPLVITSGTGIGSPGEGQLATEDVFNLDHQNPRIASEIAGAAALASGVNVSVMRLPQVHDPIKQGLISPYVEMARAKGVVATVGDGGNRWPAVHVSDAARLFRITVERGEPGARYHAVAEQGITVRDIAAVIARGLQLPLVSLTASEAMAHFGWFGPFAGMDMPASSALTQARTGWHPTGPGMIADLERMAFVAG